VAIRSGQKLILDRIKFLYSKIFRKIQKFSVKTFLTEYLVGLIFAIFVIKGAYKISFAKALLVWIFHVIAEAIAIVIGVTTFAGALFQMFH